jgi:hypothetical protein
MQSLILGHNWWAPSFVSFNACPKRQAHLRFAEASKSNISTTIDSLPGRLRRRSGEQHAEEYYAGRSLDVLLDDAVAGHDKVVRHCGKPSATKPG